MHRLHEKSASILPSVSFGPRSFTETCFWANFNSSYNIILSYLVKNSIQRNKNRWETRRGRAGEIAFVYQNNKRNESITLASKLYVFGKSMEKVTYVWKIKLSRPWTFNNDSCRLRVISHLYWWSNSEVFVDVWLFLDKSIKKKIPKEKKCVHWCGLGSIIMIWAFNSTRFVLSIPDTLLTFCFTHVSCDMQIS